MVDTDGTHWSRADPKSGAGDAPAIDLGLDHPAPERLGCRDRRRVRDLATVRPRSKTSPTVRRRTRACTSTNPSSQQSSVPAALRPPS